MFGELCNLPPGAKVLPWAWNYMYKENPLTGIDKPKAQGTCDCGKCNGVVTLEETYAACVDQTTHCFTWALSTALDHFCVDYDVGNAFAEAP